MTTNSDRAASANKINQAAQAAPTIRIQCTLHNDLRLIVGASAIAAHVAQHGGLSERAQEDLATAAIEACREVFRLRPKRDSLLTGQLTASSFPDRVEVSVESSAARGRVGPAPRGKRPTKGAAAAKKGKAFAGALVDDVRRETREGRACITLVKYCGAVKSRPRV
jgi:anti-sigma regulatory factor (Ser/Thr protein kinase)